jgi:pilus assembly protein Flp/PilA
MRHIFKQLARSKRGATAIEYGLIVALIAIGIITAMSNVASETIQMWTGVEARVDEAIE